MLLHSNIAQALPDGLQHYGQLLNDHGFDTWEQCLDITEGDLISLSVRMGHRRRLLKAFRDARLESTKPVFLSHANIVRRSNDTPAAPQPVLGGRSAMHYRTPYANGIEQTQSESCTRPPPRIKRRYKRHPKADINAPIRPLTAFVLFSNSIRNDVLDQNLDFSQIAKIVGREWQCEDSQRRLECERVATQEKNVYDAALREYKKTPEYAAYQRYLVQFKAKQAEKESRE
ncbi:High mobility group protein 20A [Sphaceloma murrayae]|uniref:High mobility group protein 20A n=1 Tax=Sphaceloma murrayae TaxID=2082308 RepID=A0A2K1QRM5_9PEZI|nr:High mobility group protein 20A [Sphaceloma murrayae]